MGNNQDVDKEEITIEEKMNTNRCKPTEELDNNYEETLYDPEMIQ